MERAPLIILVTVAIYLALFTHVAFSPKLSNKLIATAGTVVVTCGLIFYGICYAVGGDSLPLAILNTCKAVLLLFIGENPLTIIEGSALLQGPMFQIASSALGFLGVFTTTGAALSAIGAGFLRKLRLYWQKKRDIAIIQPLNTSTLEFARELTGSKEALVVFVDEKPEASCVDAAQEFGCVIRSDEDALAANQSFLRSIGACRKGRNFTLYALSDDRFSNREFACRLADSAQSQQIPRAQTALTIFSGEAQTHNTITSRDGQYSYGTVLCISHEQLAARLLMQKAPPWESIRFDENGRATEDFHALVIGGGKVGQAVIKQLVMNGQFSGSRFTLSVFDPNFQAVSGQLCHESRMIFDNYQIHVYDQDARSNQMFAFLQAHLAELKYIVICTGKDDINREVARQLSHYLIAEGHPLPLHICSRRGIQQITREEVQRWDIYACQILCSDEIDKMAMLLNHSYCGNDKTPRENWEACDYFSRMSSRASADYAPAFLKMAGLRADAIPEGDWCTPAQLENMAISEHERWCAFHYCMGFRNMTEEEYAERCRIYKEEKAKNPASRYRIGKDVAKRIHSCLIPWEALDALSARENAVTGGNVDYKQMDRNNVLTLPDLLKSAKK